MPQEIQTTEETASSADYPKYFVTYAVTNKEAESNIFGHASLIMSEQKSKAKPIEVIDAIGFYSNVKESSTQDRVIQTLKKWLGFKMDLQSVHGHIEHEQLRFLDGPGIEGITFETEKNKFAQLIELYTKAISDEETTIKERNKQIETDPIFGGTLPENAHSRKLLENALAKQEDREPLLKNFHVTMKFNWNIRKFGYTTENSYTCKTRALAFLHDTKIINDDIRSKIYGGQFKFAFPRFSELPLTPIQLVSTGELKAFEIPDGKKSQKQKKNTELLKTVYSRAWNCCLITMDNPPTATQIPKLPSAYHSYYIQVPTREEIIYYVDRSTKLITELKIKDPNEFQERLNAIAKKKPLFEDELDIIQSFTQEHKIVDRTGLYWTGLPKTYPCLWQENEVNYQNNQHHLVRSMLIKIKTMERALLAKINAYKKDNNLGKHYDSLTHQLKEISTIKTLFIANGRNQDENNLNLLLRIAKLRLRTAKMILKPEQINYNFINRVLNNFALHKALIGFVIVLIAAIYLTGLVGVVATVGASIYSGFQFWQAYKAEDEICKMHDAYQQFRKNKKNPVPVESTYERQSDSDMPATPVF